MIFLFCFRSMQLTPLLTAQIHWSNIKADGFDKIVVQEIRYTHCIDYSYLYVWIGFAITEILIPAAFNHINLLPKFKQKSICLISQFMWIRARIWELLRFPLKRELVSSWTWVCECFGTSKINISFLFLALENIDIQTTLYIDVVQRYGTDYMVIRDVSFSFDASLIKFNYKVRNVAAFITNMLSGVVNSNWKIIKSLIDPIFNRFASVIIQKSVLQPLFDEFSIPYVNDKFFHLNSTCKDVGKSIN